MRVDRRRCLLPLAACVSGVLLIALGMTPHVPWLLYNHTPSVPIGFYFRSGASPRVGELVAFPLPVMAHDYARRRGESTDVLLLKPVLAVGGDHVSTVGGELRVNGALVGSVADSDSAGRALPRCELDRVLADGELFVGSTSTRHSFDSRYFGPVHASQIAGVYRPLQLGASRDNTPEPAL